MWIVLALVLVAEFFNGWTDAPNAIATVISTRVLTPAKAIIMATIFNTLGAMSGTAVAFTIGKDFVELKAINLVTVGSALIAIILYTAIAWHFGLPTSKTHELVAGLTGAALATSGPSVLLWTGWQKIIIGLFFSTFLGFIAGYLIILVIMWLFRQFSTGKVSRLFGRLQVLSAAFMAFSHGSNDGQKFIGIFTMTLVISGVLRKFMVPLWVILLCSAIMGIGTSIGGRRIIKTMGMRMVKLEPYQGFAAETGAATAIELASRIGVPLSTTHTINTAIMGVGAVKRFSAVRWGVAFEMVNVWLLTFPVCFMISWLVATIFEKIF